MKTTIKFISVLLAVSAIAALSSCKPEPVASINPPTQLDVLQVTDNSAELVWSGDAQTYEMFISPKPGSSGYAQSHGTNSGTGIVEGYKYTATGLIAETTYTWKLRASRDGIYSEWVEGPEFTTEAVPGPDGYRVDVPDIDGLLDVEVKIKAFVRNVSTGEPMELASADFIPDGTGATLYLPETIGDECLMEARGGEEGVPEEVEMSDPELKYTQIIFMVFDMSDEMMGFLFFWDTSAYADALIFYADRPCTITGTEQGGDVWDINFAEGYNWAQYFPTDEDVEIFTNGRPENGVWHYEEW